MTRQVSELTLGDARILKAYTIPTSDRVVQNGP